MLQPLPAEAIAREEALHRARAGALMVVEGLATVRALIKALV
jgi:hypothetical protein